MEHDIYDSLRLTATTCEKIADVLNTIAECFEKVTACLMDLIEEAAIKDDSAEAAP